MSTLMLFALNVVFLASLGSTFVLDGGTCIAYPPCTCSGDDVSCNALTTFPTFRVSNVTTSYLRLLFGNNMITTIPNNAFSNITVSNRTRIYLDLDNNQIYSIPENAFRGIENAIVELRLFNNNLAQVPWFFKPLTNLEVLDLTGNPIKSLTSSYSTLYSLRYTLRVLYIDLKGFDPPWPVELNVLASLTELHVRYLNLTHLEYDTLQTFEEKLLYLSIKYSQLENIPVIICHMKNLEKLYFMFNKNLHTKSTIYEPCNPKLTKLTTISLQGSNLRYMPDVLQNVPSLTHLILDQNKLSYIDWDLVPSNSSLVYLIIGHNDFTRVPSAISKLTKLQTLALSSNKIRSIEEFDLNTLGQLHSLHLSQNPIEYISPHAFKYNTALTYMNLQYTNIQKLPSSLSSLKNPFNINLNNCPIQCTCDLSFMKTLNFSRLTIDGYCYNLPIKIQTFLITDLPHCP